MAREIVVRNQRLPWGSAVEEMSVSINLAQLLRRSIYTQDGTVGFWGTFLTMTRLVRGLSGWWAGPLRISEEALTWGESLRKGFAEDLGIALTAVFAGDYGWNGVGPQFIDNMKQYHGLKGARPDLLFTLHNGLQLAAEGKGRILTGQAAPGSPPNKQQQKWLARMSDWEATIGVQWFLSSAWASQQQIVVDLFDPGEPRRLLPPALLDLAVASRDAAISDSAPPSRLALPSGTTAASASLRIESPRSEDPPTTLALIVLDDPIADVPALTDGDARAGVAIATDDLMLAAGGRIVVALIRDEADGDLGRLIGPHIGHPEPPTDGLSSDLGDEDEDEETLVGVTIGKPLGPHGWGRLLRDGSFVVDIGYMRRLPLGSFRAGDHALRGRLEKDHEFINPPKGAMADTIAVMDVRFRSPSEAARQILGRSANGLKEWRTKDGRPIGEVLAVPAEPSPATRKRRVPPGRQRGGRARGR